MKQSLQLASDPLAELLAAFPLPIAFAGRVSLTAPWGLSVPRNAVLFGVLTGSACCLIGCGMGEGVTIAEGDFIAISSACECQLTSGWEGRPVAVEQLLRRPGQAFRTSLACGGGGTQTSLIGGILEFNGHGVHPLHCALPPILHLTRNVDLKASELGVTYSAIEREVQAGRPGARAIVSHLAQILLIQAARLFLAKSGGATTDALQGLLHRELGPAVALIHRQPETPWTVASLAERVNMSRSAFSAAFTKVLGVPPVQFLREHRMRTACQLLQDSTLGLKDVSSRVGYDSVSAFSTAFRRHTGLAPGDFRRQELSTRRT